MPKLAEELTDLAVRRKKAPGLYFVGGVAGLALHITQSGARSWVLRVVVGGARREMGLGAYPSVTLAMARDKAREARELIRQGVDPIERQRALQSVLRASVASALTFDQCAERYIEAHEAGWRNPKHCQQWRSSLKQYASPSMGSLLVRDVALPHVLAALEPIWQEKPETASRVRGRIERVLDWAKGRGYRSGDNPAGWKGNLDAQFPESKKLARTLGKAKHHPALPVESIGVFMKQLRAAEGIGALALEFAILTAARSGEVRGATWAEVDRKAKVWTVPDARMKAGKEHRVPLSDAAMAVLDRAKALPRFADSDLVFPAPRGGPLSDMTLSAVLRRMGVAAVPHGFRSTFRDWAAERTSYPREAAEMALAHTIGDKVEAAYRRGDLFEKRRHMMAAWAAFLGKIERPTQVLEFGANRA